MRIAPRVAIAATSLVLAMGAGPARAQSPGGAEPTHGSALPPAVPLAITVLELDSDDAEDQAEALSAALRSRVRAQPGFTLVETPQTLSALVVALRCPPRPDPACLQRMGDHLHAERFVWGLLARGPATRTVTADVHLWTRGKPEAQARETYSDNLKDPADESLRKVASRVFERLTGAQAAGAVVVRTSAERGTVLVDGSPRGTLEHGNARIEVTAGAHVVEVQAGGYVPAREDVQVPSGGEIAVHPVLSRVDAGDAPTPVERRRTFPTMRVIGWSLIGLGGAAAAVGIVEGVRFLELRSDLDEQRARVPRSFSDVCAEEAESEGNAVIACRQVTSTRNARTLGILFGGLGAALAITGGALLYAHSGSDRRVRLSPSFGPNSAFMDARVSF